MVPEDDVDMEALQAQIDMSMSFAHDLVTSWIKPTHLAQLRASGVNTTHILEEGLRQPPRLGVGAPIPTAPPLAHEASKLKHKLGKKATIGEGSAESQPRETSKSDDEEHKGRPSKRKIKADPFGHEGSKKKRKAEPKINSCSSAGNAEQSALGDLAKHNPSSGKEKQRLRPDDRRSHATEGSVTLISSPLERLPAQITFSPSLSAPAAPSLLDPSRETSVPVPGKLATPEWSRLQTNFMSMADKAELLGIPLLNLEGPPEVIDKAGNTSELTNAKKKRKRRKKKKHKTTGSRDD